MFVKVPQKDSIIKRCPNNCLPKIKKDDSTALGYILMHELFFGKFGNYCEICGTVLIEHRNRHPDHTICNDCKQTILLDDYASFCPNCGKPK